MNDSITRWVIKRTDTLTEVGLYYLLILWIASWSFVYFEGLSFWDSLWMACVTATSTGYGDFAAKTVGGRIVAIVLMHSTIFVIIPLIVVRLLNLVTEDRNAFTHEEQEEIKETLRQVRDNLNKV